jgi:hypothetical protein
LRFGTHGPSPAASADPLSSDASAGSRPPSPPEPPAPELLLAAPLDEPLPEPPLLEPAPLDAAPLDAPLLEPAPLDAPLLDASIGSLPEVPLFEVHPHPPAATSATTTSRQGPHGVVRGYRMLDCIARK